MVQVVQEFPVADRAKPFRIEGNFSHEIDIPPLVAQRKANGFLARYVTMMVIAGEPQLILRQKPVWQVPAVLNLPDHGEVGHVGVVYVDAHTGELSSLTEDEIHHMQELAHAIAAHYASFTAAAGCLPQRSDVYQRPTGDTIGRI